MIAGLKPYPAYKDTGVPWLGKVPEHWTVAPAFAVYAPRQVKNVGMVEKTVLSLSYGHIVVKPPEKLHGLVPESYETYQIVDPGDIVVRTTDLQNDQKSLRVGIARDRGIITSAYLCLRPRGDLGTEYGYALLNAYDLQKVLYGLGSGLRQNLDFRQIKRMPVLIPPSDEQAAIVGFLASADRRVRRYVRAKQKLIKLLEEQKQAIIHRAVTRGLDPNVPLTHSGVDWFGDIPANWSMTRAKWAFSEVDDRSVDGSETLLSLRMYQGLVPHNEVSDIPIPAGNLVGYKRVQPGQLVMNRMRAAIGMFAVASRSGIVSPDYAVFNSSLGIHPDYFVCLFKTDQVKAQFRLASKGLGTGSSGFMRLYTDRFGNVALPLPPYQDQVTITSEIARLILPVAGPQERARQQLALLAEFHSRLIGDVVSGRVDVRASATSLPDVLSNLDTVESIECEDAELGEVGEDGAYEEADE